MTIFGSSSVFPASLLWAGLRRLSKSIKKLQNFNRSGITVC